MKAINLKKATKSALAALLVLCMSTMLIPAVAFAEWAEKGDYKFSVDATDNDEGGMTHEPTVSVTGNAVGVKADNGHTASATLAPGVLAGKDAVTVIADNGGQATVTTAGLIESTTGDGVSVTANNGGQVTVESRNIIALGAGQALLPETAGHGIVANTPGNGDVSTVSITAGNIAARNGVSVNAGGNSHVSITAENVVAERTVLRASGNAEVDASFTNVNGKHALDVFSDLDLLNLIPLENGISFLAEDNGTIDALVSNVISGTNNGVQLLEAYENENIKLTTWKIEKGSEGKFVDGLEGFNTEEFARAIDYIVKVSEIASGMAGQAAAVTEALTGNLRAAKDIWGAALDTSHGYDVANEGMKVYLVVDEGYKIVSAKNANDSQKVLQDANGDWYIVVKRGGGIDLQATVEAVDDLFTVIFQNDDGTKLQTTKYLYNAIPDYTGKTPTKAADSRYVYTWSGWAPALERVRGNITYTATFDKTAKETEKNSDNASKPSSSAGSGNVGTASTWGMSANTAADNATPATGDSVPVWPAMVTLLAAAVALGISRAKLQPAHKAYKGKHVR